MAERPGGVGSRREARERALALLYEAETKGSRGDEVLDTQPIEVEEYAADVVSGVADHQAALDELIASYAKGWALDRMPRLDLTILRMAAYELLHRPDVPANVAINEAVELAKRYSTDDSGRFVNGVLAAISAAHPRV